ncbi:MAG TPA: hypothetical protein VMW47_00360 [Verrucomicrobiae bacterium]|nr:hypothetical protein [Verrucomicrobiae bacterium]
MGLFRHPSEGALRQLADEPWLVPDRIHRHVAGCGACGAAAREAAGQAGAVCLMLAPPAGSIGAEALAAAWEGIGQRAGDPAAGAQWGRLWRGLGWVEARLRPRGWRRAGAVALALLAGAAAVSTATAAGWVVIWRPATVASVPLPLSSLRVLRRLQELGSVRLGTATSPRPAASLAAAEAQAELTLRLPARLPAGASGPPSVLVTRGATSSFTFSAARARAFAHRAGLDLPPLPPGLDGTRFWETTPPAVIVTYGGGASALLAGLPTLVVAAMRAPVVSSTGVGVAELERYLLRVPRLPATLRRAVRALGDPATTLPIPVPVRLAREQRTSVNGRPAVVIGDPSGLISVVVWEAGGVVRAVGGSLPAAVTLRLARAGG